MSSSCVWTRNVGWRLGIHVDVGRRVLVRLATAQDAVGHGVHGHQEVRAARLALHRIPRIGIASVPLRTHRHGEMASCGEPEHADAIRSDAELGGTLAYQAHGPQAIEERDRRVIALADAVAQHERGDAAAIQPARDLQTLVVRSEDAIAAAGTDDDPRPGGHVAFREVNGELRAVDIQVVERTRRAVRPQRDRPFREDVTQWWSPRRRRGWSVR